MAAAATAWQPDAMTAGDSDSGGDNGGSATIEAADITVLNGRMVERAGAFARLAGVGLIVVGALGVLAWVWVVVRQQLMIDDDTPSPFGFGGEDLSLVDRLDAFSQYVVYLVWSALAVAAGFGLRLAADFAVARTGGSLTGFLVGDPVPEGGLVGDPDPVPLEVDPFAGG
jgi:hypothetical protein